MSELIDRREFPEVLPCPFCGGKVELHYAINYKGITEYYISCRSCCYMNFESSIEKAVSKWNHRHYPADVQQAMERMKPEKVTDRWSQYGIEYGDCPTCICPVERKFWDDHQHCDRCGQALDWSE